METFLDSFAQAFLRYGATGYLLYLVIPKVLDTFSDQNPRNKSGPIPAAGRALAALALAGRETAGHLPAAR